MLKKKSTIKLICALIALCISFFVWQTPTYTADEVERVPEGVYMDDIDISGMTKEELKELIDEIIEPLKEYEFKINGPSGEGVTATLEELGIHWANEDKICSAAFIKTGGGSLIVQYKAKKDFAASGHKVSLELAVDEEKLGAFIRNNSENLSCEPVNATVKKTEEGFEIIDEIEGVVVDEEKTIEAALEALKDLVNFDPENNSITVEGEVTEPEVKAEDYEGFGALIGEGKTSFNAGDKDRVINLKLASDSFNGYIIMPGEVVSALTVFGPITAAAGYKKAPTYTASGISNEVGGGICQVVTTLYNAVLQAELKVNMRNPHSRVAAYVPYSMDAMVYAPNKAKQDFIFENNTKYPIYVETYVNDKSKNGTMGFRFYSVETRPENRVLEYQSVIISASVPAPGASPSEYFKLTYDESLVPFCEVKSEDDVYAVSVSSFYPVIQSALYKNVYVDGKQTEHTLLHVDNYRNGRNKRYLAGEWRVHPDTYIKKIEYNVETQEMIITWWSHSWDEPTTQEPTTQEPTTQEPTTQEPTTQEPTTQEPTTQEPTTQEPTTQEPTTQAPTTQEPTTEAPTEMPTEVSTEPSGE